MTDRTITYRKLNTYKYQIRKDVTITTGILPEQAIETPFINLSAEGELMLKNGYAWDGPSGPAIDTPTFMRGSLVHDAFYQLMRASELDYKQYRDQADQLLRTLCLQDGMMRFRAAYVYQAVKWFGQNNAMPSPNPAGPLFTAP